MSELSQDVVNKINDLIGLDRSVLSSAESSSELINKLKAKIDSLRDNFIVSMPREYNDESEFGKLCNKIESLSTRYATLKTDHSKIRSLIEDYKKKSSLKEAAGGSSTTEESELRDLIMRTISVQRYLIYIRSLIKLDSFSTRLDSYLSQLESLKEPTSTTNTKSSNQDLLNSNQAKQNRLNEVETLIENLVNLYTEFVDYSNEIIETKCSNLRSYIMDLRQFYFDKIKSILSSEIEKCLKNLSYPVNQNDANATAAVATSNASLSLDGKNEAQIQAANKEKFEHFFKKLAKYILTIESPSFHKLESVTDSNSNSLIKLLIQPLEKRFKFHFCTSRKTNNLDKPEWYLSQILQWIKDESEFINRLVQPMFSDIDYLKDKSAIILFSNGLVNLVGEKLDLDLNNLLKNQMQFSHTIDELILFSNQLDTYLNMASSSETTKTHSPYTTLHLICEKAALFSHWLGLERQLCEKKLDMLFISLNRLQQTGQGENSLISSKSGGGGSGGGLSMSSPSSIIFNNNEKLIDEIWSCTYSDVDSMKPSQCAETFVLMIKAITDRYYNLPYPSKKLRFVNMQIDLLNEFHMRLCQIIRGEVKNPFSKIYFGALNTVNYLIYILDEWKNSPFFIEMQYYRVKFAQHRKKSQFEATQGDDNDNNDEDSESDAFEEEVSRKFDKEFEIYDAKKNALFEMEGALFDEILPSYEKVKEDMIKTITSNLKWEITSRSRQYKKEKWMAMTSFSEIYKPTLSQSAADMLISLKNLLHLLHESVAKSLFETILKRITTELDKFFYEDVILQAQFNEGGVSQFEFDICRYLMPILSEYANEIKIESYFRKTKESIILLKLKQGSAILLKDVLNKALNESVISGSGGESGSLFSDPATDENRRLLLYNGRNALREFGVIQLNCEEARTLLNLRCDYVDLN